MTKTNDEYRNDAVRIVNILENIGYTVQEMKALCLGIASCIEQSKR